MDGFIADYFSGADRNVLFVGGAGFDPRSTVVATRIAAVAPALRALLLQEHRPKPPQNLLDRAVGNAQYLAATLVGAVIEPIDIFGADGAVIGGRNAVSVLARQDFTDLTDVVVDSSALSVGTSFPLIRYLVERIGQGKGPVNLHVFVAHDPNLDASIQSIAGDAPGYVHGFRGGSTLDGAASAAKLWLPQLAVRRRGALTRLHDFVSPHDTCPILPFPATNPRLGDELAEAFLTEFESAWSVDTRNIVYAAEDDPLDLYRTILRLDDLRRPVFQEVGGSSLVLSPVGSKVMALGALMAALERDLPVAYMEAIGYHLDGSIPTVTEASHLVHVWLEGEVYTQPRPKLHSESGSAR
ncbi:hypothetical protein [Caulobacter sp. LARHSG274]